ncbi:MAG: hypothetical protein KA521_01585 [Crocinitomicaceae bacterium]|nr:hypothetical protein [Crocinitomicaceae bacterium]
MEKEKWVANQLDKMPAYFNELVPTDELIQRLNTIPTLHHQKDKVISIKFSLSIAAGIALLISLNLYSIFQNYKPTPSETLYSSYFDYLTEIV